MTPILDPKTAGPRADKIGRLLLGAAALLHTIGGNLLSSRNEELTEALADAEKRFSQRAMMADHAYRLGRGHERAGVPAPADIPAAVAATVAPALLEQPPLLEETAAAGVLEHADPAAVLDEQPAPDLP